MSTANRGSRVARVATATALAATVTPACAAPPEQPDPRHVVGCHFFVQDTVAERLQLPWGVRLLDQPLEGWPVIERRGDVRVATTLTGREELEFPFGYWIRTHSDSLEIGYPGGGGLLLVLELENGAFRGVARPVGDALEPPAILPERRELAVRLTWARCPD
jgi:hypothetical protein